jgi:hypothetical protein
MSDSGQKTPLCLPITPPVRKKEPFSGFRSPKFALLTPLWPPKASENHPFSAHFRAPLFGHIDRIYPARQVSVASGQWPAISHSANDSMAQSLNSSMTQSPDRSITQFFPLPPLFFRLAFSPRKLYAHFPDDGVVNGPTSSRVTRSRVARTPRRL